VSGVRLLCIGSGLVGSQFAAAARAGGHSVVGTTTTPDKVGPLGEVFDEVRLLRGGDAPAVADAAAGCEAIVVTAGPSAARAMTREDRAATYREVLVDTARSVVSVPGDPHLVMLSALSVYGNAADHLASIDEDAPTTDADDPSPAMFLAAEGTYREAAGERTTILRCADIYGADDPPVEAKVRMAHEVLGGSVPFGGEALFYRVAVEDVAAAILFALERRLVGTFNLTHAEVPASNRELFDRVGAAQGFGPLEFRDEIAGPCAPVSTDRLRSAGFVPSATRAFTA
jgi:nucleoside-diphosphate-sugar epimerase